MPRFLNHSGGRPGQTCQQGPAAQQQSCHNGTPRLGNQRRQMPRQVRVIVQALNRWQGDGRSGSTGHPTLTPTPLVPGPSTSHPFTQQWAIRSSRNGEAPSGRNNGASNNGAQGTAVSPVSQLANHSSSNGAAQKQKSPPSKGGNSIGANWALRGSVHAKAEGSPDSASKQTSNSKGTKLSSPEVTHLQSQVEELRSALETATLDKLHAEARAREADLRAQEAQDALARAQEASASLTRQYSQLCAELDSRRTGEGNGSAGSSELTRQVDDLQAQLEDLDYRLGWALRDLRAHQLVLRAQGELNMHLSGLPNNMQQQIFEQVDSGAELLGDGGSATVHAITLNGEPLAVKVMPLYDINTARPYHFRDICTTFLRHQRSPYIEMPLHTFLRLKDDEVEGTQYFLYTVWPRRHMDVDQLLCRRSLRPQEIVTIMQHTVLALQDLAVARMVHADVKPPNVLVMLGADGMVQSAHLTDFGSVQFVPPGEDAAPAIWDNQLAWNWPPEQRTLVYLEACDVWGLALLYSCMKVINPSKPEVTDALQDDATTQAEFDRVRDKELLPDSSDDTPELRALTQLMRRCVVRDPYQRPSIREIAAAMQQIVGGNAPQPAAAATGAASCGAESNGAAATAAAAAAAATTAKAGQR